MALKLDYELLDFGRGRKLERFGQWVLDRPESLAIGSTALPAAQWTHQATAVYEGERTGKGVWKIRTGPKEWSIDLNMGQAPLQIQVHLGVFKHVGIFPEQEAHWNYLAQHIQPKDRLLNLFGYTGIASMVASAKGAQVYHVDSSKSILNMAATQSRLNGLDQIHWVHEDAFRFVQRELTRNRKYQWIIMDPPVFGRGPKGETWKLETMLPELLQTVAGLLEPGGQAILNTYSPTVDLAQMKRLIREIGMKTQESGHLHIPCARQSHLAMSKYVRLSR